jgi:adenylosuccinate lyase
MKTWNEGGDFKFLLLANKKVREYIKAGEIEKIFRVENFLGQLDFIFDRVFDGSED